MSRKTQGRRMRKKTAMQIRGRQNGKRSEQAGAAEPQQGQWKMTAHSMAEPRYPLRLSRQVFEVLHPAPARHWDCCGLILKPSEHALLECGGVMMPWRSPAGLAVYATGTSLLIASVIYDRGRLNLWLYIPGLCVMFGSVFLLRQRGHGRGRFRVPLRGKVPADRDLAFTMAGSALHFIVEPSVMPLFIEYMEEYQVSQGGDRLPPELYRAAVSMAHDVVAPGCPTPIEAM